MPPKQFLAADLEPESAHYVFCRENRVHIETLIPEENKQLHDKLCDEDEKVNVQAEAELWALTTERLDKEFEALPEAEKEKYAQKGVERLYEKYNFLREKGLLVENEESLKQKEEYEKRKKMTTEGSTDETVQKKDAVGDEDDKPKFDDD